MRENPYPNHSRREGEKGTEEEEGRKEGESEDRKEGKKEGGTSGPVLSFYVSGL